MAGLAIHSPPLISLPIAYPINDLADADDEDPGYSDQKSGVVAAYQSSMVHWATSSLPFNSGLSLRCPLTINQSIKKMALNETTQIHVYFGYDISAPVELDF